MADPESQEPLLANREEDKTTLNLEYFAEESKRLWSLAAPLAFQNLFSSGNAVLAIMFVGHLDALSLSVAVLGTSVYNVTGTSVLMGMSCAMEPLCGQAAGAGNYRKVGATLKRALLISTILSCLISLMWWKLEVILVALGQDPTISKGAAHYLHFCIPALFFSGYIECFKRYLMAQGVVNPPMIIACGSTCLTPVFMWLFIWHLGYGVYGAAMAFALTIVLMGVTMGGVIIARDVANRGTELQTFYGLFTDAFSGWVEYLQFGIPSMLMICLEWWTFELLVLMSGLIPPAELSVSVMGVCMNTSFLFYVLPMGFTGATATRVSNELGAGQGTKAKKATEVGLINVGLVQLFFAFVLVVGRHVIGKLFASDPEVLENVAFVLLFLAAYMPPDGLQAVLQGVLRGSGNPHLAAVLNVVVYWAVAIPLAVYLAFKAGMGVAGLWTAITVGVTLITIACGIAIARFDWDFQAERAQKRTTEGKPSVLRQLSFNPGLSFVGTGESMTLPKMM